MELGLSENQIEIIHDGQRPPIPKETLNRLLYNSRSTCCVCRDSKKSIIIHHIIPWEESHSHSEDNLVVLCLEHHDQAHTSHQLSTNLTPERLRELKCNWVKYVKSEDKKVANGILGGSSAYWDYFNITRLFEMGESMGVDYERNNKYFKELLDGGYINKDGLLKPNHEWQVKTDNQSYWLSFIGGSSIVYYLKNVLEKILTKLDILVLNSMWDRSTILAKVKPGDTILVQGAFFFRGAKRTRNGMNQSRLGYRRAKKIKIEFEFDAWYCSSSSSYSEHLNGRSVVTAILLVRSLSTDIKKHLVIKCSVLAMGSFFNDYYEGRFWPQMDIYGDYGGCDEDEMWEQGDIS